jgi:uncharacterized protein YjdB
MKNLSKRKRRIIVAVMICCMLATPMFALQTIPAYAASLPKIRYEAHSQSYGWLGYVDAGKTAGVTGKSKRLEAIRIKLTSNGKSMVSYKVHMQSVGWEKDWSTSGQIAGSTGKSKRIEAVRIKLTNGYENKYDIYYRLHLAHYGWLGWAKNGAVSGSTGLAIQAEAIQIKLVKKGDSFNTGGRKTLTEPELTYQAHTETNGWMSVVSERKTAGTTGKGKRLEAIKINLKGFSGENAILYRAHVAKDGWENTWKTSGQVAGTTGKSKAIEAVQIKLTGVMSSCFDVYYRVHCKGYGWLGWAKNGEKAGTTGGAVRAEAIQIEIVPKKSAYNRGDAAYLDLSKQNTLQDPNFYMKQYSGSTNCTLYACAHMMRRKCVLDGRSDWSIINQEAVENEYSPLASAVWTNGRGLNGYFSYQMTSDYTLTGHCVKVGGLSKDALIQLLKEHPEGIECYDESIPHGILVTSYDANTDTFYCVDSDPYQPAGIIKLSECLLGDRHGNDQNYVLASISSYWYLD